MARTKWAGEPGKWGMVGFVRAGQTADNENENDISSTTLLASEGKIGKNEDNISSTIHLIVHLCC